MGNIAEAFGVDPLAILDLNSDVCIDAGGSGVGRVIVLPLDAVPPQGYHYPGPATECAL